MDETHRNSGDTGLPPVHGSWRRVREWPPWAGYAVAVGLELALTAVLVAVMPVINLGRYPVYYFLSVAAVAYWFGLGPAIVAFVLALAGYTRFFVDPMGEWWSIPDSAEDAAALIAFMVGAVVGVLGVLIIRRSRRRIQRLANELAVSNERVTDILESITDAFYALDREWRFTYVNPEAARLLGRGPGDLLGRRFWDEFPEAVGSMTETAFMHAREERIPVSFEEYFTPLAKWLDVRAYPGEEGLSVYVRDITEEKRVQETVRRSEERRIEFYRRTLLAATGGRLVITGQAEILAIAGETVGQWEINTAGDLWPIRRRVGEFAAEVGIDEHRRERFKTCVGEAATNALKHAGGGTASLHRLPDGIMVVVADSGRGIAEMSLPDVALTRGYSTAGTLGMGYKIMLSFADKVYLATGPDGTTVGLELKETPVAASPCVPDVVAGSIV